MRDTLTSKTNWGTNPQRFGTKIWFEFFFFDKPPLFQTKKFWFLKKYKPEGFRTKIWFEKITETPWFGTKFCLGFLEKKIRREKNSREYYAKSVNANERYVTQESSEDPIVVVADDDDEAADLRSPLISPFRSRFW